MNLMCEALGVSRSGYYAWLVRPRSRRSLDDEFLGGQVRNSFIGSDRTYGARRVWHDVLDLGRRCGLHRIERLMRAQALRAVGWSMQASMSSQLVADALMMAVWGRGRPQAVLHHSDQGSEYTCEHFQRLLTERGLT